MSAVTPDERAGMGEPIEAEMVVYRVLAAPYAFKDRLAGNSHVLEVQAGPSADDTVRVTVGDVPDAFYEAMRAHRGWGRFLMEAMFLGTHGGKSPDELEEAVASSLPDADDLRVKMEPKGQTFVTLEVRRPVIAIGDPNRQHRWLTDVAAAEPLEGFATEASEFLDVAAVRLLPAMPDRLAPASVIYRKPRAFLVASGKTPIIMPSLQAGSASLTVSSEGWESLDFERTRAAVESLGVGADDRYRLTRTPSRWLWAALGEEKDRLRRFQFAFFGLEVLANKAGAKFEQTVAAKLTENLGGLPLEVLMWPTPREADSPWRNLLFRFAIVAIHLNPDGAAEDIEQFKALAKARNSLAHGAAADEDMDHLPDREAVQLLRSYLERLAGWQSST